MNFEGISLEAILSVVSAVVGVVAVITAAKGSILTEAVLKKANRFDVVVALFAWIDRHILRSKLRPEIEQSGTSGN